ncbi:SURP and G-patch domain-containing protein 1-like protein [Zea mays]|uniref:SURP and G-patch domain-containing protein 1-like protein n=1 Tax=Zea mays TaxID=4577 RepID=A0A1D6IHK3_MAIZE|nr:SURP and G-patch domain-containing protein 1-like protein [Zea mays]
MTVRQVADKLASFVAKNGRQFENITRQRNPGDTPFKFLFDKNCPDYKYYEFQLAEEERALAQSKEAEASKANSGTASFKAPGGTYRSSFEQKSNYQTPASALYGAYEGSSSQGSSSSYGDHTAPPSDPVALMEFYAKKAALEERKRPPRQSKDEMPPPPSLQGPPKKGHHMGDFIPQEELEKFMARCNDAAAQKATKEAAEKAKIQADNIGHKLLSKMGWREGEGLGSERRGRADPVMAGDVKKDHLGVGAVQPGEVTSEDDIYEQYKKRMMLGYRYRPNPLVILAAIACFQVFCYFCLPDASAIFAEQSKEIILLMWGSSSEGR